MVISVLSTARRRRLGAEARRARTSLWRLGAALFAAVIYNLVGLFDILSTEAAINLGAGQEANPVLRAMMSAFGAQWITIKLMLQMLITAMVLWYPHWIVTSIFAVAITGNAYVVYNNFVITGLI